MLVCLAEKPRTFIRAVFLQMLLGKSPKSRPIKLLIRIEAYKLIVPSVFYGFLVIF